MFRWAIHILLTTFPFTDFLPRRNKFRKRPSSVSLNFPLRFLSPYQEAVCAISTRGRSFPQHGISRFEVLTSGSKIRNQNCSLKLLPRGEVLQPSSVRSRTFNTVRSAVKQLLRGANSSQALRRIFVEPQRCFGTDRMRALSLIHI